jgi:hypothetical protein
MKICITAHNCTIYICNHSPTPQFSFLFCPYFCTLVRCTQEVVGSRQLTPLLSFYFFSVFFFNVSLFLSLFFAFIYPSYNVILPDAGCLPAQHPNFRYIGRRQFISLNYWCDTRHQPISQNLKPICILYIIWGRMQFYDDTNSLILNLALHLVNCVAARLVFFFYLSCAIYYVPKACDHCPWPSSQFNEWHAQNELLSASIIRCHREGAAHDSLPLHTREPLSPHGLYSLNFEKNYD